MLPKWKYHKGNYRCPTPKCHYIVTKQYIIENGVRVRSDLNLMCPRCNNAHLVGYIGKKE